jgi:pyruvate kinase
MRRRRNSKIIATLGPKTANREMIQALFEAGADAFRINMSHTSHANLKLLHGLIREVEESVGRPIAILADLQGPKIRIGDFANPPVTLKAGHKFRLDRTGEPGDGKRISLPHPEVFSALEPKAEVLLDDGRVRLQVEHVTKTHVDTKVLVGGELSNKKGVNVPGRLLPVAALTPKDRADLEAAASLGVDWIALSFVQRPDDVAETRKLVAGRAAVLAKIEKPAALERLDEIVELSDGVMVARGDLGVETHVEDVPGIQKRLIRTARVSGKMVIVATQMLESMIHAPVPTRAEVSDVANAVYEGADAVMLSAESATGDYPLEAVGVMDRVARKIEAEQYYRQILAAQRPEPDATASDAITAAARQVAETLNASAIVTFTTSGSTAMRASRERPSVPILVLTPDIRTARRLALSWGLHCVKTKDVSSFQAMVEKACRIARREEFADYGQRIVVTAGVPFGTPGATNVLRIAWLSQENEKSAGA